MGYGPDNLGTVVTVPAGPRVFPLRQNGQSSYTTTTLLGLRGLF